MSKHSPRFGKDPTPSELLELGNKKYIQGDFSLALHTYRIGLEILDTKIKNLKAKLKAEYQLRNRIIAALYALREYKKAKLECDALIGLMGKNKEETNFYKNSLGKVYIRKGGCHYFLREPKEAQECYQAAMKIVTDQALFLKAKEFLKLVSNAKVSKKNMLHPIYNLPTSASHRIAEFLDAKTICKMNFVAFAFHEVADSKLLWRSLCSRDFPEQKEGVKDWKKHYLNLLSNKNSRFWYTWAQENKESSSKDFINLQLRYSNEACLKIEKVFKDVITITLVYGEWRKNKNKITFKGMKLRIAEQKDQKIKETQSKDLETECIVEFEEDSKGLLKVLSTKGEFATSLKDKTLKQIQEEPKSY